MSYESRHILVVFLGLILLALTAPRSAVALSITWDSWSLGSPVVTASTHGVGSGSAAAHQLLARSSVITELLDLSTWGNENASTSITLSSSFTVQPDAPYQIGLPIDGRLTGNLTGALSATGLNIPLNLLGSYTVSVNAAVDAGFASWNSPSSGHSIHSTLLQIGTVTQPIADTIAQNGTLIIGQAYTFTMTLTASVQKNDSYSVLSDFELNPNKLFADVIITGNPPDPPAVPEPSSIVLLLSGIVAGAPVIMKIRRQM